MRRLACVMAAVAVAACVACGDSQDDGISTSVGAKLTADQKAGTSQVKVETKNQVVTLSGTVDSPAAKEQAVRAARETEGVTDVVDNIQVTDAEASGGIGESAARAGDAVVDTAKATGTVVAEGAKTTGSAVAEGAKVTGTAVVKGTEAVAKPVGDAAKTAGTATVKGAEATASGAKKLGSGIVGAVTPDEEKK